jgi:uncharacterized protein
VPRSGNADLVLVDSGGWIALLSARDQHHAEADGLFRRAVRDRVSLVTTNLVLAEVHRFILFRVGIRAAAAALARIESSPRVRLEFATESHHRTAHGWLTRFPDQRLTYTDAIRFAVMRATRCGAALTFDHHFTIAGFTLWR